MNESDFKSYNFSLLGANSYFEGDLSFEGDVILAGHLKGTINIKKGKLTLERTSKTEGTIYCEDIEVFGEFSGAINSSGVTSIRSSAVVSGNIKAKKLSIFPGAQLNMEGETSDTPEENQSPSHIQ